MNDHIVGNIRFNNNRHLKNHHLRLEQILQCAVNKLREAEEEAGTAKTDCERLRLRCLELGRENEQMKKALKVVEYIKAEDLLTFPELYTAEDISTPICPHCGYKKADGHFEDCPIGQALEGDNTE